MKRSQRAWRAHRQLLISLRLYPGMGFLRERIRISYLDVLAAVGWDLAMSRSEPTLAEYLVASGGVS